MSVTALAVRARGWVSIAVCGVLHFSAFTRAAEPGFFEEHPELQFIEQRLPPTATLVIPPPADRGRHVATDGELSVAFSRVLEEFLAPPSTFAPKAGRLIAEVCRYRPAQSAQWAAVAIGRLLEQSLPGAEKEAGEAVGSAVAANPAAAASIMSGSIGAIVRAVETRAIPLESAGRIAGGTVRAAMDAAGAVQDSAAIMGVIAVQSLHAAMEREAHYLVIEIMAASVMGAQDRIPLGDLCQAAFVRFGRTKDLTGLIAVGAMKGAGAEAANVIKDQAALSLPVPVAASAVVVCNAYAAVLSAPAAEPQIPRLLPVAAADFVPAVMLGAIGARPEEAVEILRAGLDRDLVLHGRATTREILESAILACGWKAPALAAAAVGHGDTTEGSAPAQIAEAIARAAAPSVLIAALNAQMQVRKMNVDEAKAVVGGAIAGAVAAQRLPMLGAIASAVTTGTGFGAEVLDQAMIAAPADLQYAAAMGVIAADREHAAALLDRALHHHDLAPGQAGPLAAGGGLILAIQRDPLDFFHAAATRLLSRENSSNETSQAIVLGVALANPRGAPAVAAAASVATDLPPGILLGAASLGDRSAEEAVAAAVGAARHVKLGTGDLVRFVREQVAADPGLAPEVVTGCVVAAPALADVIGAAAVAAAPQAVAQIVPRLFAFSAARNPLAPQPEPAPVALAAITDGVMRGILAHREDAESEDRAVADGTAAAVKSALAFTRNPALAASRDSALAAVITAAAHAAGAHAVAVARTAARIVRTVCHEEADGEKIRVAVLAAHPAVDAAKIADAVGAGFAESDAQIPAPNAKALLDYAHDPLTGTPMTRYRDL